MDYRSALLKKLLELEAGGKSEFTWNELISYAMKMGATYYTAEKLVLQLSYAGVLERVRRGVYKLNKDMLVRVKS